MSKVDEWNAGPDEWDRDPFAGMAAAGLFRVGLDGTGGHAAIARATSKLAERTGLLGLASAWAARQLVARFFIAGFAGEAQRAYWMPRLTNSACAAVAISEPGVGAHPKHLTTRAVPDGDSVRLTGEKAWITNGPIADVFVVLAITAEAGARKRYSAFLVPRETAGLTVTDMPAFHALRPARHSGLVLDACRVPCSAMLGSANVAYETMARPFRDVEDAIGLSGLSGVIAFALSRLRPAASAEAALSLGGLLGLAAVLADGARDLAVALDGDELDQYAAKLVGLRLLAADLRDPIRAHCTSFGAGPDAAIGRVLTDLDAVLSIARGPRAIRQARLAT